MTIDDHTTPEGQRGGPIYRFDSPKKRGLNDVIHADNTKPILDVGEFVPFANITTMPLEVQTWRACEGIYQQERR